MAITPSLYSSSPCLSLLSPKIHHSFLFPFSQPHLPIRKFDRYTFSTVGSRHTLHLSLRPCAVNLNSQTIKAEASVNREPMVPPYNVLITGSTKGIGYALAKEFLKAGDNVIICSRTAERVESAVQGLREEFGEQHVWGTKCDVKDGQDVKDLVAFAQRELKYIDIWINNAGSNAYSYKPLAEASDEDLIEVVTTNTLGLMICCREAIKMMLNQHRGGHIFNIDGAGSDGRPTPSQEWSQLIFLCLVQPQSRPSFSLMFWQNQLMWLQNTLFQTSDQFLSMDQRSPHIFVSSLG